MQDPAGHWKGRHNQCVCVGVLSIGYPEATVTRDSQAAGASLRELRGLNMLAVLCIFHCASTIHLCVGSSSWSSTLLASLNALFPQIMNCDSAQWESQLTEARPTYFYTQLAHCVSWLYSNAATKPANQVLKDEPWLYEKPENFVVTIKH